MVMKEYWTWPSSSSAILALVSGLMVAASSPKTEQRPAVGLRYPIRILMVVVLPVPFLPRRPVIVPLATVKLKSE